MNLFYQRTDNCLISELFESDRLDYCLSVLVSETCPACWKHGIDMTPRHGYGTTLAILDGHLAKNAKNKTEMGKLDKILFNMCSDMAAFDQILSMVRLHRPRGT